MACHQTFLNLIAFNLVLSCRGFDFVQNGKTNKKRSELVPCEGFIFWEWVFDSYIFFYSQSS